MKALHSFYMILICLITSSAVMAGGHNAAAPSGQAVFEASCANCHDSLIGGFFSGAPRIGSKADWAAAVPKGIDALTQTTIAGIGKMKPRGDCLECTNEEIRAAIEYILKQTP